MYRLVIIAFALVMLCITFSPAGARSKIPVYSSDDLPRHTYTIPGRASDLLDDRDAFATLAEAVRRDIESELSTFEILDAPTLINRQGLLMSLSMLSGDLDGALERIRLRRELETKEAARLTSGISAEITIEALRAAGDDLGRRREIVQDRTIERLRGLPWEVIAASVRERKQFTESFGEKMLHAYVQNHVDPTVSAAGEIGEHSARQIVTAVWMLEFAVPYQEARIAAYEILIRENHQEKENIWPGTCFSLVEEGDGTPVRVAIWDTGVDIDLFEDRLFVNQGERFDGRDTDGNGYVDDVHGIAFDHDDQPTTGLLTPLDGLHGTYAEALRHAKGQDDLEAAIDSDEASALRRFLAELEPDAYESFYEDQQLVGIYRHGTHVAGIAAAGNPFIRLLPVRITYDHHMILPKPTIEKARAESAVTDAVVEYCRQQAVRVVNMSWLETREMSERRLEKHAAGEAAGETAADRAALARRIFEVNRSHLESAIRNAPEILFVAAAGNFDTDVEFDESIPAGLDLPNLLVVGAVDQAGEPTTFTSFGGTVDVYANGYQVESVVPGGEREKFSGTSMSAPAGANLAAKVLAIRPQLTPPEVIELIIAGAKPSPADASILLINPLATIALATRQIAADGR